MADLTDLFGESSDDDDFTPAERSKANDADIKGTEKTPWMGHHIRTFQCPSSMSLITSNIYVIAICGAINTASLHRKKSIWIPSNHQILAIEHLAHFQARYIFYLFKAWADVWHVRVQGTHVHRECSTSWVAKEPHMLRSKALNSTEDMADCLLALQSRVSLTCMMLHTSLVRYYHMTMSFLVAKSVFTCMRIL